MKHECDQNVHVYKMTEMQVPLGSSIHVVYTPLFKRKSPIVLKKGSRSF